MILNSKLVNTVGPFFHASYYMDTTMSYTADIVKSVYSGLPIGINILYVQPSGVIATAIVQKTDNKYGTFLIFGYGTDLVQYKLYNGIWNK